MDHFSFFAEWKNLINYCIPLEHDKNQYELFNVAVTTFITAFNDKQMNAVKSYGFGLILESMVSKYEMIKLEVLQKWLELNANDESKDLAICQIQTFIEILSNEDDESDSDSDY